MSHLGLGFKDFGRDSSTGNDDTVLSFATKYWHRATYDINVEAISFAS